MMSPIRVSARRYQESVSVSRGTAPLHLSAFSPVKQSKKRLRFQPTVAVKHVDYTMTKEEKSRSYYSKKEYGTHALETKAIFHSLKSRELSHPALRGLELYRCPIRIRRKVFVQKALLKYQKDMNADLKKTREEKLHCLAAVSAQLSQWSKSVARETARLDSRRARDPDYLIDIKGPVETLAIPETKRPRRVSDASDKGTEPEKRRRLH